MRKPIDISTLKTPEDWLNTSLKAGSEHFRDFFNTWKTFAILNDKDLFDSNTSSFVKDSNFYDCINLYYSRKNGEATEILYNELIQDKDFLFKLLDAVTGFSPETKAELKNYVEKLISINTLQNFSAPFVFENFFKNHNDADNFSPKNAPDLKFQVGTLNYVAARPSRGKTTLMVNLMLDAVEQEKNVVFVNCEVPIPHLYAKIIHSMIYREIKKDLPKFDFSVFNNDDLLKLTEDYFQGKPFPDLDKYKTYKKYFEKCYNRLIELYTLQKVLILDAIALTKSQIIAILSRQKPKTVVFIDYLQLIKFDQSDVSTGYNRYQLVGLCSHDFLNLAQFYNLIIISGCQMNKEGADKDFDSPENLKQTAMRESDDILMDANVLIGLGKATENRYFWKLLKSRDGKNDFNSYYFDTNMAFSYMESTTDRVEEDNSDSGTDKNKGITKTELNKEFTSKKDLVRILKKLWTSKKEQELRQIVFNVDQGNSKGI